ncbi:MAG: RNA polymerase sigma factor [Bacteroidales bacterium]|nr:RNA polymerase sigma factor [Bacteroidales bacterium]
MKIIDESQIVERLSKPEERKKAFEEMVCAYRETVYWQIRRMVFNHDDADDIMQNTFVKAWTSIDKFRAESKLSTWLYRIAMNETLTFLSRQQQRRQVSIDEVDNNLLNTLESDYYFDGDELQYHFQQALQTLPPKQRQVFNLRYFDEMSYDNISSMLGTSVGALKASYHYAVIKIQKYLEELE